MAQHNPAPRTPLDDGHAALHWAVSEFSSNVAALNNAIKALLWVESWATMPARRNHASASVNAAERRMHVLAVALGFEVGMTRDGQDIARQFGVTRAVVNLDARQLRQQFGIAWPVGGGGNGAKHFASGACKAAAEARRCGYVSRGA